MKFDSTKLTWENYIQEVAEALVTLLVLKFFVTFVYKKSDFNKVLNLQFIILTSLIIGLITMFIEFISPSLKDSIKQGIGFSAGVFMLKGAL